VHFGHRLRVRRNLQQRTMRWRRHHGLRVEWLSNRPGVPCKRVRSLRDLCRLQPGAVWPAGTADRVCLYRRRLQGVHGQQSVWRRASLHRRNLRNVLHERTMRPERGLRLRLLHLLERRAMRFGAALRRRSLRRDVERTYRGSCPVEASARPSRRSPRNQNPPREPRNDARFYTARAHALRKRYNPLVSRSGSQGWRYKGDG
jgi:hypothetical protein